MCIGKRDSEMEEVEWLVINGDVLLGRMDANLRTDRSSQPSLLTVSNEHLNKPLVDDIFMTIIDGKMMSATMMRVLHILTVG